MDRLTPPPSSLTLRASPSPQREFTPEDRSGFSSDDVGSVQSFNPDADQEQQLEAQFQGRATRLSSASSSLVSFETGPEDQEVYYSSSSEEPGAPVRIKPSPASEADIRDRLCEFPLVPIAEGLLLNSRKQDHDPELDYYTLTLITTYSDPATGEPSLVDRKRIASAIQRPKVLQDLDREVGILSRLEHPNIVKFIGCQFREAGREVETVIRMTYAGEDISALYKSGAGVGIPGMITHQYDFWCGATYLHTVAKVLHRDLCPKNYMLLNGRGVIIDFDNAHDARFGQLAFGVAGQDYYMSPETRRGQAQNFSADVFSGSLTWMVLFKYQGYIDARSLERQVPRKNKAEQIIKPILTEKGGQSPVISDLFTCYRRGLTPASCERPAAQKLKDTLANLLQREQDSAPGKDLTAVSAEKPIFPK